MPFDGSGGFDPIAAPNYPAVAGQPIYASQFNANMTDLFGGFANCVTRDGQSPWTANLPAGGFKVTGLGDANANGQAVVFGQTTPVALGGQLQLGLGSVGTPSYSFTGDLDTGMWSPAADTIAWSLAGSEYLRLATTGLSGTRFTFSQSANAGVTSSVANPNTGAGAFGRFSVLSDGGTLNIDTYSAASSVPNQTWLYTVGAHDLVLGSAGVARARLSGTTGVMTYLFRTINDAPSAGAAFNEYKAAGVTYGYIGDRSGVIGAGAGMTIRSDSALYFAVNGAVEGMVLSANRNLTLNAPAAGTSLTVNGVAGATRTALINGSYTELQLASVAYGFLGDRTGVVGSGSGVALRSEGLLTLAAGGTAGRLELATDGRLYGNALHNNAGAVTGTTNQYIASGTYTPTITAVANATVPASSVFKWTRIGNVVEISGTFTFTITAAATVTTLGISLPIASNFAAATDATGALTTASAALMPVGALIADTVNDRVQWGSTSGAGSAATPSQVWMIARYEVL